MLRAMPPLATSPALSGEVICTLSRGPLRGHPRMVTCSGGKRCPRIRPNDLDQYDYRHTRCQIIPSRPRANHPHPRTANERVAVATRSFTWGAEPIVWTGSAGSFNRESQSNGYPRVWPNHRQQVKSVTAAAVDSRRHSPPFHPPAHHRTERHEMSRNPSVRKPLVHRFIHTPQKPLTASANPHSVPLVLCVKVSECCQNPFGSI